MELQNGGKRQEDMEKEIIEEIRRLAGAFTPEWKFDVEDPDTGSVIAMIFAAQTADTIRRCHMILGKYHTEFVNLFGISPKPASPAHAVAVLHTTQDAAHGIEIKNKTRFLAEREDEHGQVVFTTRHDLYVTHARLVSLWMVSHKAAGYHKLTEYPFRMFEWEEGAITENALLLYHSFAINGGSDVLCLRMSGTYSRKQFAEELEDSQKYRISYYSSQEVIPAEKVWRENDCLCIQKAVKEGQKTRKQPTALLIERLLPLYQDIEAETIELYPRGIVQKADFIQDDNQELDCDRAAIFGEELAVYQSCYLGQEEVFQKRGARITIAFELTFEEHLVQAQPLQEPSSLPVIKRKERSLYQQAAIKVCAQEVSVSYYNGKGWRRLELEKEITALFAGPKTEGGYEIVFLCPEDWEPVTVGSYEQRCLRLQITRADNCYMRPARHCYPVLSELLFHYEYEKGKVLVPQRLERRQEGSIEDITQVFHQQGRIRVFEAFPLEGESIVLGLDKKPEKGPVSLYFLLENYVNHSGLEVSFEYSSRHGFKSLKVEDNTQGFTCSGTVLWIPPEDMEQSIIAAETCFWIRIRVKEVLGEQPYYPMVHQIYLNAVEMWNVNTQKEQEFYLDQAGADMSFGLNGTNILSAEVWVNEQDQLTEGQMHKLLQKYPKETQAEYDLYGDICAFYVKWEERENFDVSKAQARHYIIDRIENRIIFGDGIQVKIPRMLKDTAFKVILHTCSGQDGNVRKGAIHTPCISQMFLEKVENLLPAAGGSNLEEQERIQRRAGTLFGSRRRLVTKQDYIHEVLNFSDTIDKVQCIPGRRITGEVDLRCISIAVLMKEYKEGSMAFYNMEKQLKEHLFSQCEISYMPQEIQIVEPVFVRVSVDLWVKLDKMEHVMEIQEDICRQIYNFLNPLSGQYEMGWEIGRLPREKQIQMLLNAIHTEARILYHVVTLSYVDHMGKHQVDLSEAEDMPFGICMNGSHQVHLAAETGKEELCFKVKT